MLLRVLETVPPCLAIFYTSVTVPPSSEGSFFLHFRWNFLLSYFTKEKHSMISLTKIKIIEFGFRVRTTVSFSSFLSHEKGTFSDRFVLKSSQERNWAVQLLWFKTLIAIFFSVFLYVSIPLSFSWCRGNLKIWTSQEPHRSPSLFIDLFKFHYTSTRVTFYSQGTSDLFPYVRLSQKNVINNYELWNHFSIYATDQRAFWMVQLTKFHLFTQRQQNQFCSRNSKFIQPRSAPVYLYQQTLIDNVLRLGSICRVHYTSPRVPADNGGYKIRVSFLSPWLSSTLHFPTQDGSFVPAVAGLVSAPVSDHW